MLNYFKLQIVVMSIGCGASNFGDPLVELKAKTIDRFFQKSIDLCVYPG